MSCSAVQALLAELTQACYSCILADACALRHNVLTTHSRETDLQNTAHLRPWSVHWETAARGLLTNASIFHLTIHW